jgi:hypothetical protein
MAKELDVASWSRKKNKNGSKHHRYTCNTSTSRKFHYFNTNESNIYTHRYVPSSQVPLQELSPPNARQELDPSEPRSVPPRFMEPMVQQPPLLYRRVQEQDFSEQGFQEPGTINAENVSTHIFLLYFVIFC